MYTVRCIHVPDLGYSLVSVSNMHLRGFYTVFGAMQCGLNTQASEIVTTGTIHGSQYKLDTGPSHTTTESALFAQDLDIWHQRLEHISTHTIRKVAVDGSVTGIKLSRDSDVDPYGG